MPGNWATSNLKIDMYPPNVRQPLLMLYQAIISRHSLYLQVHIWNVGTINESQMLLLATLLSPLALEISSIPQILKLSLSAIQHSQNLESTRKRIWSTNIYISDLCKIRSLQIYYRYGVYLPILHILSYKKNIHAYIYAYICVHDISM